jgi:protein tyrosine/serine phosphatase
MLRAERAVVMARVASLSLPRSRPFQAGWRWLLLMGWLAGLLLFAAPDALRLNFHQVARGRAYRCGQLSPSVLKGRLAIHRIRSIVNLRGPNPQRSWYQDEKRIAAETGICLYDIAITSESAPTSGELRELVRIFTTCPKPVLIHCESGLDRTGLVAAICLLVEKECSVERARQQMGLRYGIPPWRERTRRHRGFVDLYEAWLQEQGAAHTSERFLFWACHVYHRPESLGGADWPVYGAIR